MSTRRCVVVGVGNAAAERLGDREPDGVVAPKRVADADHDVAGAAHRRATVRSRKCVAHEMHGS